MLKNRFDCSSCLSVCETSLENRFYISSFLVKTVKHQGEENKNYHQSYGSPATWWTVNCNTLLWNMYACIECELCKWRHFTPNIGECILIFNFNLLESQALGSIYISIFNKYFSIISSLYPLFIAFVSRYSYNLMVTTIVYILWARICKLLQ